MFPINVFSANHVRSKNVLTQIYVWKVWWEDSFLVFCFSTAPIHADVPFWFPAFQISKVILKLHVQMRLTKNFLSSS